MKSESVPYRSYGVDNGNSVVVDGSDSLDHRSTVPPQSEVVSVAHISNYDVVASQFATHTVILLIHSCEVFRNRSDLRVCENDRDVLPPRSGNGSIDIIR